MKPIVTIIMATYNRAHYIKETLDSIQSQTYENWECLIIDDGSTDNTFEVVSNFIKNDKRFSYQKRPYTYKKGLPGSRNFGLDICKGDYVIFFDDDDIIHPDNLKISFETLKGSGFYFCHYHKLSFEVAKPNFGKIEIVNKKTITNDDLEKVIRQEIGLASCTVLWDKNCFKTHRFNEELMYAEEWECYNRILSEGYSGVEIDAVLYFNRKHPNSNTGEFYNNNPIRKESKKEAILLVIKNLQEKKLLTNSLLRYFLQMALNFKEYNLFERILITVKLSFAKQIKWIIFYSLLPIRLALFKLKKQLVKK